MGRLRINRPVAAELLRDPETFMLTVFVILVTTYGDDVYLADPLEIYAAIGEDFNADIPLQLENRINAGLTCIPNDSFYTDLRVFKSVCNSLYTGDLGDDLLLDPVTLPEILWAVYEMELLRGTEDEPDFAPNILSFIRSVAAKESVSVDEQEDLDSLRSSFIMESIKDLSVQLKKIGLNESQIDEALGTSGGG
jgi:hypothetical protein